MHDDFSRSENLVYNTDRHVFKISLELPFDLLTYNTVNLAPVCLYTNTDVDRPTRCKSPLLSKRALRSQRAPSDASGDSRLR